MTGVYTTPPIEAIVGVCVDEISYQCGSSPAFVPNACVKDTVVVASSQVTLVLLGYDKNRSDGTTHELHFRVKVITK